MSGLVIDAACDRCLAGTWLLERLSQHIELRRADVLELLCLPDRDLIAALAGKAEIAAIKREYARVLQNGAPDLRERAGSLGVDLLCRCDTRYPARLCDLDSPPRVLHIRGAAERFLKLVSAPTVAVVGTRRPTQEGVAVAQALGRGLAASGIAVVSGMALGIDGAAHEGAIAGGGAAIAVLPASVSEPHPVSKRRLFARLVAAGGVGVGELGLCSAARRWTFIARNRIVAALGDATVVVQARHGSGSEVTTRLAADLGRAVGAVPGSVLLAQAAGPNALLVRGSAVIRGAQDVLDLLFGFGARNAETEHLPVLSSGQAATLAAVRSGASTLAELEGAGIDPRVALIEVAALELSGRLRRAEGGRLVAIV